MKTFTQFSNIYQLVDQAFQAGQSIDLSGIHYGKHVTQRIEHAPDYYHFLAGFVQVTGAARILEIGTHEGGSARSLRAGCLHIQESLIVTVDITDEGDKYLKDVECIHKVTGDANSEEAIEAICNLFDNKAIDLLFLDLTHTYLETLHSLTTYRMLLSPQYILIDDITLNDSMQKMWRQLTKTTARAKILNVADYQPDVRNQTARPGLGLICC